MGRSEALTVAALGRSPYDDVVIPARNPGSQRFDDRGHPINPKSRRSIKDFIRASNEVLKAAGIIEEDSEVRARDDAYQRSLAKETETGIRLVEFGRLMLVTGVWGVCGLRRRILLYDSYANTDFLDVLRYEATNTTLSQRILGGIPSMLAYQGLEWISLILRALITGTYEESSSEDSQTRETSGFRRGLWKVVDLMLTYASVPYNALAVQQQLHLVSPRQLFPSPWAFLIFSQASPLPLPTLPSGFTRKALTSWSLTLIETIAPMSAVLLYHRLSPSVAYSIFSSIYMMLPKPINRSPSARSSLMGAQPPPRSNSFGATTQSQPEAEISAAEEILAAAELSNELSQAMTEESDTLGLVEGGPSQHAATLRALEGETSANVMPDRDFSDDENEVTQTTLISFDVEPTGIPDSNAGPWSAELRNTNEATTKPREDVVYHITALTLLPPLLAAEALSTVSTDLIMLPLEAIMVRTLALAFRKREGLGTFNFRTVFSLEQFTVHRIVNIVAVQALELAVTGVLWAGLTIALKRYGDHQVKQLKPKGEEDES